MSLRQGWERAWDQFAALLYGLAFFIGVQGALSGAILCSILFSALFLLPLCCAYSKRALVHVFLSALLTVTAFFYAATIHTFPSLPPEGVKGTGIFEISSISPQQTSFGSQWIYRGDMRSFTSGEHLIADNIPITIRLPRREDVNRPEGHHAYHIEGTLKQSSTGAFYLQTSKSAPWTPLLDTWSLAEPRMRAKQTAAHYIQSKIDNVPAANFLSGIATGQFDDRLMSYELSRFGLQHLMAVSGFHFALLAGMVGTLLSLFLPRTLAAIALIITLTGYFIFLGFSPSVMRAWVSITILQCGILFARGSVSLNSLGVGLLMILLVDPLASTTIGFQFSFLITASILLFYPAMDQLLQQIFLKRTLAQAIQMNALNQHGYFLVATLRKACALSLAINIAALPLTLYYFNTFPLMSLFYNLFFPFLAAISMTLLAISAALDLLFPLIAAWIHQLNNALMTMVLNLAYNLPHSFDVNLRLSPFSSTYLITYFVLLFFGGLLVYNASTQRQDIYTHSNF